MTTPAFEQAMQTGLAEHRAGNLLAAESAYRQALAVDPAAPDALHLLGMIAHQTGRPQEAVQWISRAISIQPDAADYHGNLGLALAALGRSNEAIAVYERCLQIQPDHAVSLCNLGSLLRSLGKLDEAISLLRQAVQLRPDYFQAYNNLGNALQDKEILDEAIDCFTRAIELRPDNSRLHHNLGNAYFVLGDVDRAIASYEKGMELKPDDAAIASRRLIALQYHPRFDAASILAEYRLWNQRYAQPLQPRVPKNPGGLSSGVKPCFPSSGTPGEGWGGGLGPHKEPGRLVERNPPPLSSPGVPEEEVSTPGILGAPLPPSVAQQEIRVDARRRLKIGYVSADFRDHVAGWYLWPLLSRHDHGQFEIFCYSNVSRPDAMTKRLAKHADTWREIRNLSDQAAAELIQADQIDILVDLSMHTDNHRLLVLARKPASVQVAWLAYPGTTGVSAIDYRLTDPYFDPPGEHDDWHSEISIRLPETFLCYEPMAIGNADLEITWPPMVKNGYVTFGCLNKASRLNDRVWQLWSPVLRCLPDSRLILSVPNAAQARILAGLAAHGVDSRRVEFLPHLPWQRYLEYYHRIDVILDTLPYNGNTTSMDALWMGVPLITRIGNTVAGRAGWSLLSNLKLTELAARSNEQFAQIALELAGDAARLAELRSILRRRMLDSPLCDAVKFTRNVEAAYRRMCHIS